jgi:phosphate transport system ATP-binding protein
LSNTNGIENTAEAGGPVHESVESGKLTEVSESQESTESSGVPEVAGGEAAGLALARSQARLAEMAGEHGTAPQEGRDVVFGLDSVSVSYTGNVAIRDVNFEIHQHLVTAFIGPSGCGKTTLLRSMNRMNDLIPGAAVDGTIRYHGNDLFGAGVDAVEVRRRIGMVFQRPNPFPKSIYDNVAFGLRLHGMKDDLKGRVERALRQAALWDEVHDRLKDSALSLSGGQQQRLCIARALAIEPDVLLMDEPASALDPIATQRIEDLVVELKDQYTIVIVTHNMQQAARVADMTAFFSVDVDESGRSGVLVEYGPTSDVFIRPRDDRTEAYVTGRFG